MPQVDFNTFIFMILPFIILLLIFFNSIGFFNLILTNFQKKNETVFGLFNYMVNNNKNKKDLNLDQEQAFLTKIKYLCL